MTYNGNSERLINDKIIININGLFICPFCTKSFRALVYHTRQVHGIGAIDLRKMFGLPLNYSLEVKDLKEQRRKQALENNMDKQLIHAGIKTRFYKNMIQSKSIIKRIKLGHIKSIRKIVREE